MLLMRSLGADLVSVLKKAGEAMGTGYKEGGKFSEY